MPVLNVSCNAITTDATQTCVQNKEKEVIHHTVVSRSVELQWRVLWMQNCMQVKGETGQVLRKGCCLWEFSGLRMSAREESSKRIAEELRSRWCQNMLQVEIVGNWECMTDEVSCMVILSISDHCSQFSLCKGTFLKHHVLVS